MRKSKDVLRNPTTPCISESHNCFTNDYVSIDLLSTVVYREIKIVVMDH